MTTTPSPFDLSNIQWRMPEWVQSVGGLRTENVLDYFSFSPFYDHKSNNQMLKMQSQFNALDLGDLNNHLRRLTGTQFVVTHERPPFLWIIQKQHRLNEQEVKPLSTYFVCNENIYMAPNAYTLLATRMLNATHSLQTALKKIENIPQYHPQEGYTYPQKISDNPSSQGKDLQETNKNENTNAENNVDYTFSAEDFSVVRAFMMSLQSLHNPAQTPSNP
ncbi:mediator complex subunit Pmc5 [Schizosaccharomyces cryophilus OY26]|uniref:Mediator of RNA polymerase II transcription subunit 6 n=1 Tax=Schizosaccharomyces cryophilus (strain OY26 / ATCC MYA-4695 / CBS 11777 / NBRC 106824 / NRRL Y48691) TaxID=653667 RepID=S9XEG4_SCHCR|nr:mediator complex subunit Pmc5 [Schizosaccharomyces cryophilus OY26]EPY52181.1 mediator complex subunit Pmc5 [Schizosaccharomyces cryophilus OY26]